MSLGTTLRWLLLFAGTSLTSALPLQAQEPPRAPVLADASDTARGDTARGDTARGDTARGDTARGDTARGDTARGDTARAEPPGSDDAPAGPPLAPPERRPLPDYDGRGPEPGRRGAAWLWLPRILLSPLYVTTEFVVRRPLGYVVTTAERQEWPALIVDFFTFGPRRNAGIVPTALLDFGFRASVGALVFWNDAGTRGNDLRLRAAWGGPDWRTFSASDFLELTPRQELGLRIGYAQRPDWAFHGLGPESGSSKARYRETRVVAGVEHSTWGWRSSVVTSTVNVRDSRFDPELSCCEQRSVADEVARGRYPLPEGMRGYTVLRSGLEAALDTRRPRKLADPRPGSDHVSPSSSGFRLAGRALHGAGVRALGSAPASGGSRYEWVSYGATLGGYADLTGLQRVLGLELLVDFADPVLDDGAIPFTELVSLGGRRPMRGFLEGRLRDRSAVVAHVEYQYPVWVWLDGALHYDVGNVFGAGLEGLEAGRLRQSFGLGLRVNNVHEHAFELLVGAGTRTFDDGAGIDTVRLVVGASSGF